MSLARIYSGVTGLGQTIIRKLTDVGGPPASRVSEELDSLIAWAKLSPRCIHRDTSTVGNVGAGLDDLHSFSLPAGSLATDGDFLRVEYAGSIVAGVTATIRNLMDGQIAADTGAFVQTAAADWRFQVTYIRLSATSVRAKTTVIIGVELDGVGDNYVFTLSATLTVANLNSNAVTLLVRGQSSGGVIANNDVTQNLSIIELTQQ